MGVLKSDHRDLIAGHTSSFANDLATAFANDLATAFANDLATAFANDLATAFANDLATAFAKDLATAFAKASRPIQSLWVWVISVMLPSENCLSMPVLGTTSDFAKEFCLKQVKLIF